MGEEERADRDRILRLEETWKHLDQRMTEGFDQVKTMLGTLANDIRSNYVPRDVLEERFKAVGERDGRLEARMRDAEASIAALQTRPQPKPEEPGWVKVLIALVSILGGALVTLIVTLTIYYQAKP